MKAIVCSTCAHPNPLLEFGFPPFAANCSNCGKKLEPKDLKMVWQIGDLPEENTMVTDERNIYIIEKIENKILYFRGGISDTDWRRYRPLTKHELSDVMGNAPDIVFI